MQYLFLLTGLKNMKTISIALALIVVCTDLLTKWWVKSTLSLHYYPVIEGFFTVHYVENRGIVFGFFNEFHSEWKSPVLAMLALFAIGMVLYYIWTTPTSELLVMAAFGLVLGGILGNFFDRLFHGFVVDFIKLHWRGEWAWPTFNVADSAITTGVILIMTSNVVGSLDKSEKDHNTVSE